MAPTGDAPMVRMALRLRALHEQNGGDWTGTARSALALIHGAHALDPRGGAGPGHGGTETPDAAREDD
ncbi:MAG: hypothetical protein ICV73_12885 [Acetobacteraceae bacterium]|nr:hypothetical protein [Acetobacteraceae bacterium]